MVLSGDDDETLTTRCISFVLNCRSSKSNLAFLKMKFRPFCDVDIKSPYFSTSDLKSTLLSNIPF